ncbi:MAG: diaminopimelate decarboxylase [Limnobacter sp.]|nr:diaminopimelate decarboxylase [Limnobacter sp.]
MNLQSITPELSYSHDELHLEAVNLIDLAQQYGTPLYVYSLTHIRKNYLSYAQACSAEFDITICYAVKANSNIHLLKELASLGAGFDIVSAGEMARALAAGGQPEKMVFAGVGKTRGEISFALEKGVGCFNVESFQEMERIADVAQSMGKVAPISLRVNPDVDAKTHPYISTGLKENKFGVSMREAPAVYRFAHACDSLEVRGIDCHIGSQLIDASPYSAALDRVLALVDSLHNEGIEIQHLDLGGGIGIRYHEETPPDIRQVLNHLATQVKEWATRTGKPLPSLAFEPGRSIVGNSGVLVTEVQYLKENEGKHFAIIDAAMNDLMRPALYEAFHAAANLRENTQAPVQEYDLVGPVCETGDWLAKNRKLSLEQGDYVALLSAGAYGQTMASNYNSRGRAAEVLVDGPAHRLIRRRETIQDQLAPELDL